MTRVALLEGPIARTLFELAWPVLAVLALQTFVGVAETYFVSFLGTSAIAGVALVFPLFMLMTMMSNGGIGGGVSSAVARARSRAQRRRASARGARSGHCRGIRCHQRVRDGEAAHVQEFQHGPSPRSRKPSIIGNPLVAIHPFTPSCF